MTRRFPFAVPILAASLFLGADPSFCVAQAGGTADTSAPVVINREALQLRDPQAYQVTLQLEPIRSVQLSAPVDGQVRAVPIKPGQGIDAQAEVVRLDSTERQLELERAKANYKIAQIEARRAKAGKEADATELADAKLAAAKADLDLATYRNERASIRAPFKGTVFGVQVVEGQFVQLGDPLATIGDTSQLKVEIPVDRGNDAVAPGKPIEIRVEDQTLEGTVETILPLSPRFEPIRDLVHSVATAVVIVDNSNGELSAGQTVYASLIPRHPVTEVPTAALANAVEGGRKVQVVRDGVIRDVDVQLLGQVGDDRVFVSGSFAENDELVISASQELADGTRIRPAAAAATAPAGRPQPQPARGNTPPPTKSAGF